MEDKFENILKFLHDIERLKNITRHSWTSSGRQESVAEHSWRLALMAYVLQKEFQDINISRVVELALVHDLGEAYTGDFPAFKAQPNDKILREEKAVKEMVRLLEPEVQNKIIGLIKEFNECKTAEARLANALDKLEVLIQHNEADLSTWEPKEYEYNLVHGKEHMNFHESIKKFRAVIDRQTKEKITKGND